MYSSTSVRILLPFINVWVWIMNLLNDDFDSILFSVAIQQSKSICLSAKECEHLTNRKPIKDFYQNKQCQSTKIDDPCRKSIKIPNDKWIFWLRFASAIRSVGCRHHLVMLKTPQLRTIGSLKQNTFFSCHQNSKKKSHWAVFCVKGKQLTSIINDIVTF